MLNTEYWPSSFFVFLWTKMKLRSITLQKKKEANIQPFWGNNRVQRKSFLQLAIQASWSEHLLTQKSFQLAPKTFWLAELISQFFCYLNSSKNITYPSGKLKTEFTSRIAKSTSPELLTLLSLHAGTSLVNIGFIIWPKRELFLTELMWEIPSGQDEPILLAWVANQNSGFTSSCPLVDSAIW